MTTEHKTRTRRSFFGPILLIIVGLLFLAYNLGFVPGEGWDTIWKLWPLLLIVAGLDDLIRREGIAWPIILIGAGTFLLLNYFGPQVWISWTQVIQLWPIILIAVGIDVMFKGESGWNTLIGVVLTVILVGGAIWIASSEYKVAADYRDIQETYSISNVSKSAIDLSLGLGELIVSNSSSKGVLIEGNVTPGDIDRNFDDSGTSLSYQLENNVPTIYPHTSRWELGLADDLELDLSVNNGVGEVFLALENLDLENFDVNQGVGRLFIRLPEEITDEILIKQAVGTIQIVLSEGKYVIVDAQNGLSKIDYPSGFELSNGYYASPGASRENAELKIVIEQAIGLIEIQYAK